MLASEQLLEDMIVASPEILSLDESTERIVAYLSEREIPINVLCFQVFTHGSEQLISRAWLLDPVQTQTSAAVKPDEPKEPWNGEFYVSFGGEARSWADAVKYGFISAGGGAWYSKTLHLLNPGDRIWVKVPGSGFVGVGRITGPPESASSFRVKTENGDAPVLDVATGAHLHRKYIDDLERCEYFVPVDWLQTVPLEKAINEIGFFGNQNTVCKPTTPKWRYTVDRLKQRLPDFDK
jgi:hypothetical protein